MMAQITRWEPGRRDVGLARALNDMVERMQRSFGTEPWWEGETELAQTWAPSVDIYDKDDHIVVQAELPGIKKSDIDIRVEDNVLSVSGERTRERKVEEEGYYRTERHYGKFGRSFRLPSRVDPDNIDASFEDGVLTIQVPKAEESKAKQIRVK
jgi:HSP20 family protein